MAFTLSERTILSVSNRKLDQQQLDIHQLFSFFFKTDFLGTSPWRLVFSESSTYGMPIMIKVGFTREHLKTDLFPILQGQVY